MSNTWAEALAAEFPVGMPREGGAIRGLGSAQLRKGPAGGKPPTRGWGDGLSACGSMPLRARLVRDWQPDPIGWLALSGVAGLFRQARFRAPSGDASTLSCDEQQPSEQERDPGDSGASRAPVAGQGGSRHGQASGVARPVDPRTDWAVRLDYLASNATLFARESG